MTSEHLINCLIVLFFICGILSFTTGVKKNNKGMLLFGMTSSAVSLLAICVIVLSCMNLT